MTNIVPMKNIWVKPLSKADKKRLGQIFQRFQQAKKGELEESVALALQNYRDGAIDADDLVAFLLPTRLEEIRVPEGESIILNDRATLENVKVIGIEGEKENDDETGQGT